MTDMFCYQCEQTAGAVACTRSGVCGKSAEVAALQDLVVYALRGLSLQVRAGRDYGVDENRIGAFTCEALFSTLTNVNFDPERFVPIINKAVALREEVSAQIAGAGGHEVPGAGPLQFAPAGTVAELVAQAGVAALNADTEVDADIRSLQHILLFGLKGVAAYADHARILGQEDGQIYAFLHDALAAPCDAGLSAGDWLQMVLKCGEVNLRTMELLDNANTGVYGHPVPTRVPLGAKKGKAILVSGHDLKDLDGVLRQTAGKGIYVYTHGEMLPCHGYPELKKHEHFYGHYGTAWQNQKKEFDEFPGAILMTTNCIQKPAETYRDNIFTTGLVGFPGVRHIADKDFTPLIERALALPGYLEDSDKGSVMVGFGHNAVLGLADTVVGAVKSGAIRHFFLVGGCDGAKPGRSYYTEFVEKVPGDCVVLTLACGKFRFFDKQLGDIGGIPRLLDIGQCNDAFSALQIAMALAGAFGCSVNELPLSIILSWYEQKAVAILLSLLHLGITDMRIGPTLPAFITPAILDTLVNKFGIKPITTPDEDLKAILGPDF